MIEIKNLKKWMWDLAAAMQGALYSKDVGFSIVRLVFLKYATDNCLGVKTMDEMQHYMQLQKTFSIRDVEGGPNSVWPVISIIDEHYKLNGLMRASITDYERELFGLDESRNFRNNASTNIFKRIMDVLASVDLTDDEIYTVGKMLVNELLEVLRGNTESVKFPYWSRKEVGEIAKKILKVREEETFLDFASGIGSTTIAIVGETKCKIKNSEVNVKVSLVSAMLYIMQGYNNFIVEISDSFVPQIDEYREISEEEKADKIFVDSPIGLKIKDSPLKEASLIGLCQAVNKLKENGTALITVSPLVLSGLGKIQEIRKLLIESGYIQSIISLPLSYPSSTITINLVVVSKKTNRKILFVNACAEEFKQHIETSSKVRGGTHISQEGIELISKIVNENLEIESISKSVDISCFIKETFDLSPKLYVAQSIVTENITVNDIDRELNFLYKQLREVIK